MPATATYTDTVSEQHLEHFHAEEPERQSPAEQAAAEQRTADARRKTRVRIAIIYALTTIIPLLVMFYIIQANVFLRTSMGVVTVGILAFIALLIALLGGRIMKDVWGKIGQAVETIERLRTESDPLKEMADLEQTDEIDRIPTVVMHLVEVAKRQMSELKAYNEQVQHLNEKLQEANEKLSQLSREDSLTGLFNRRYFDDRVVEEITRTKRYGRDLALAMVDIDFFKDYNDKTGHLAGDKALATIGAIVRKSIRETDLPFRYGGEEFAILLPETTVESATSVAQRIRKAVEKEAFHGESYQPNVSLTVSIGISLLRNDCHGVEDFVSVADKALYKAKSLGRNRVVALAEE